MYNLHTVCKSAHVNGALVVIQGLVVRIPMGEQQVHVYSNGEVSQRMCRGQWHSLRLWFLDELTDRGFYDALTCENKKQT